MTKTTGILMIITAMICLSAYSYHLHTPYQFSYPAYFGNNIALPADNPAREQGIQLGRMLTDITFITGKRFSNPFN